MNIAVCVVDDVTSFSPNQAKEKHCEVIVRSHKLVGCRPITMLLRLALLKPGFGR